MRSLVPLAAPALVLVLVACGDPNPPTAPAPSSPATPVAPPIQRAPTGALPAAEPPAATTPPPVAGPPPTRDAIRARYSPHLQNCLESGQAAAGVTWAMAGCVGDELKLQDGALNAEYQRIMGLIEGDRREALRRSERAWIAQRDALCLAQRSGGTLDQVNVLYCHLDQTIGRMIDLERMGVR